MPNELLRYRNFIIAIVIIAVFITIIANIFSHYNEEFAKIEAKRQELRTGKETLERWEAIDKEYRRLENVFLSRDPALFKSFVESKARDNNIQISSINMTRQDLGYYWTVEIVFEATAYYRDFMAFVAAMEEKKVQVTQLSLGGKSGQASGGIAEGLTVRSTLKGVIIK